MTVGTWLASVRGELDGRGIDLEYSVRLVPGRVIATGRATCWCDQSPGAGQAIRRLLGLFGAPPEVLAVQQGDLGLRQGLGIDATGPEPVYRLYVHSRRPDTLAPEYRSWRWTPGSQAAAAERGYSFHFLPETPEGLRPAELVQDQLRPMLEELLADGELMRRSGFWLRTTPAGVIDRLDVAFPWHPAAGSIPGLAALARHLAAGQDTCWQDLPVRHVAISVPPAPAAVTLYVRGRPPATGLWMRASCKRRREAGRRRSAGRSGCRSPSLPVHPGRRAAL